MSSPYDPKQYWEHRLGNCFNYQGVGNIGFSEAYNSWLYRRKKRCIESFFRETTLKGKHVLDVGCGTGFFIKWYLQHGADVCGIDITETSTRELEKLYDCKFFTQDIASPSYQPYREFDIVNMWDVVYHVIEPAAFNRIFDNISNSLKEGGILLFTDWFGAASDVRIAEHVQTRCLDTYRQMLSPRFKLVTVCPLYNILNKPHLPILDNYMGWLFFLVDNLTRKVSRDNLSLAVWRYSRMNSLPGASN